MEYSAVIVVAVVVAICAFFGFLAERWSRPNCSINRKTGFSEHVDLPSEDDVLAGKSRPDNTE